MVGDDHLHAARSGVFHGLVGGDAGIAGQDEFCTLVNDFLQMWNIDAVTLALAHRDVVGDIRAQGMQGLDEHGRGGLPVHIEITPDANGLAGTDGALHPVCGGGKPGQVCGRGGGIRIRVQKGASGFGRVVIPRRMSVCATSGCRSGRGAGE